MRLAILLIILLVLMPAAIAEGLPQLSTDTAASITEPTEIAQYIGNAANDPASARLLIQNLPPAAGGDPMIIQALGKAYAADPTLMDENMGIAANYFSSPDSIYSGQTLGEYLQRADGKYVLKDTGNPSKVRVVQAGDVPGQLTLLTPEGKRTLDLRYLGEGTQIIVGDSTFKICPAGTGCTADKSVEIGDAVLADAPAPDNLFKGTTIAIDKAGNVVKVLIDNIPVIQCDSDVVTRIVNADSKIVVLDMATGDRVDLYSKDGPITVTKDPISGADIALKSAQEATIQRDGTEWSFSAGQQSDVTVKLQDDIVGRGAHFEATHYKQEEGSPSSTVDVRIGTEQTDVRIGTKQGAPRAGEIVIQDDLSSVQDSTKDTVVDYFHDSHFIFGAHNVQGFITTVTDGTPDPKVEVAMAQGINPTDATKLTAAPTISYADSGTYEFSPATSTGAPTPRLVVGSPAAASQMSATPTVGPRITLEITGKDGEHELSHADETAPVMTTSGAAAATTSQHTTGIFESLGADASELLDTAADYMTGLVSSSPQNSARFGESAVQSKPVLVATATDKDAAQKSSDVYLQPTAQAQAVTSDKSAPATRDDVAAIKAQSQQLSLELKTRQPSDEPGLLDAVAAAYDRFANSGTIFVDALSSTEGGTAAPYTTTTVNEPSTMPGETSAALDIPVAVVTGTPTPPLPQESIDQTKAYAKFYDGESDSAKRNLDNAREYTTFSRSIWPAVGQDGEPLPMAVPDNLRGDLKKYAPLVFDNKGVDLDDPKLQFYPPNYEQLDKGTLKSAGQVGVVIRTNQAGKTLVVPANDDFKLGNFYKMAQQIAAKK